MAKVYSSLAGKMRGRVGSTVFRSGQKATVASQYNPSVANPRSAAQAVQRAAFATATTAQSALASIVDHSHEKMSGRRANLQRFVQQNTEMVRAGILADYSGGETNVLPTIRGARNISPAPYVISEGSLLFPRTQIYDLEDIMAAGFPTLSTPAENITTQAEYEAALASIGLLPGDQLSLIAIIQDNDTQIASVTINDYPYPQFACEVVKARVTFVTELPAGFSGSLFHAGVFNSALIARREGTMLASIEQTGSDQVFLASLPVVGNQYILAAAVLVRSQESGDKVLYSNGRMACYLEPESDIAWPRAQSYMDGAKVQLGDMPFLDNPLTLVSTSSGSGVLQAVATFDSDVMPALVTSAGGSFDVELPGAPSEVVINVRYNNVTKQSTNLVSSVADEAVASFETGQSLKAVSASTYGSGKFTRTLEAENSGVMILSGYAIVNGQRYTF